MGLVKLLIVVDDVERVGVGGVGVDYVEAVVQGVEVGVQKGVPAPPHKRRLASGAKKAEQGRRRRRHQ